MWEGATTQGERGQEERSATRFFVLFCFFLRVAAAVVLPPLLLREEFGRPLVLVDGQVHANAL